MFEVTIKEFNVNAPVFVPKNISVQYKNLKNVNIDTLVNNINKLINEISEIYADNHMFDKLEMEFIQKNPWIFE